MRERITGLIDDRTKMLAAISHDLRTPITRMRLRSEFIEDEAHRSRMLDDLDQMRSMLESVLSFLRNDRRLEAMTLVDIASTLQLITDQFGDMGRKVAYDGPAHAMATVRPDDLHRAVTNLVENAVRFGAEAAIRLRVSADQLTIDVEDDGPGISDALKQNMLEPFVRGDEARNMDEAAGFGLGLSITNAIVTRAWRRAVAARPAAAWTGGSDAIAGSPAERALGGLDHRVRPRARRDRLPRRSRSPRSDNRRRGRTRGRTCGPDCSRPNRVSGSACHTGHRDFREADSRNRVEPWRISLTSDVVLCLDFVMSLNETGLLSKLNILRGTLRYTFTASFARQSCASA